MSNKPLRFYYGWVIVAVSFLTIFLAMGTRLSFGVFYVAILEEFGWGRAETAGAFSTALVCHAMFAPITGIFIDRIGPRRLFPLGVILLFLGLLAASRVNHIWHLYITFGIIMAIGINIISIAPHMSIVHRWFIRKKGLATGLMMSGTGVGGLVLVPFSELMIETFNWRLAFIILSCIILCILLPVIAIFHRNSPADVGQYPDGIAPGKDNPLKFYPDRDAVSPEAQRTWTFASAIRVKAFWFIELACMCEGFIMSMLLVHQAVFIVDVGYSKMFAASIVGIVGLLGSAGGILSGFFSDHIGSKKAYTLGFAASFIGILFLISIKDSGFPWMVYTFAILYGIGNGGKLPMIGTITGGLFPGNALGRIMSIQAMGFGIFGAVGAYVGGFFYDQMETYLIPFLILLVISILGLFSIWMTSHHSH